MRSFKKLVVTAFLVYFLPAIQLAPVASAQSQATMATPAKADAPDPADQGWHVDAAPYLWFAGISGTVGAAGRQASVHVRAGDVLSNLDIGVMGAVEARYNRIVIPIDFMWVKLSDDKATPLGFVASSLNVKINEDIFTPKIGYRLVSNPRFKADALVGIRYWHLGTTLKLQPSVLGSSFYGSADWVDAVAGAKFQAMLTPKTILTIAGDAGGGGSGTKLDYQVVGLIGYKLKRVTLQGGWRYLVIHKQPISGSFIDLAQTGVIVGAVISLK
ncbi:MAG TPA: hypothetical protein VGF61_23450 [Candidatus Acidoferrum sp.]|jgi:hypothetical protein